MCCINFSIKNENGGFNMFLTSSSPCMCGCGCGYLREREGEREMFHASTQSSLHLIHVQKDVFILLGTGLYGYLNFKNVLLRFMVLLSTFM